MDSDGVTMLEALGHIIAPVSFILGACVGSFLNVVIHRLPNGQSVVSPGSHCPECGFPIRAYDNIPLISYLTLFGLCRDCGVSISPRYFFIELATAIITAAIATKYGLSFQTLMLLGLAWSLVATTIIDLNYQIIPDELSLGALVIGLAASPFLLIGFKSAVIGALLGGGVFFFIAIIYPGSMGGGDIKLMGAIGSFLGVKLAFLTIFIASVVGAVIGSLAMIFYGKSRKAKIPLGPFLALGAIVSILWGPDIITAYKVYGGLL